MLPHLIFLSLLLLADLPLELDLVSKEHLPPAHVVRQGPHVRGDGVTGGLDYLFPQRVTLAQLQVERARGGFRGTIHELTPSLSNKHGCSGGLLGCRGP